MPLAADLSGGVRALERLTPDGPLVLALSGGGDSMALACLMADTAARTGQPFHALIVDHRLRAGSGEEAAFAAAQARALGAHAHTLEWDAPSPGQAAARMARHRLLASAARTLGARRIFLAHTAEDVIETLLMRLSRDGAGWRALAAMGALAPSPAWPEGRGLTIARPLVRTTRSALRTLLTSRGVRWAEDPSNTSRAFERVRVRAAAPAADSPAGTGLLSLNDAALRADEMVRRSASALIAAAGRIWPWGGVSLDPAAFARVPRDVSFRALEVLVMAVSGQARAADPAVLQSLLNAVLRGQAAGGGGVLVTRESVLGRDPGATSGRADGYRGAQSLRIRAGDCEVFDGRMLVCAGALPLTVSAFSRDNVPVAGIPARLRPSLVAIHGGDDTVIAGQDAVPGGGAAGALIAERLAGLLDVSADGTGREIV